MDSAVYMHGTRKVGKRAARRLQLLGQQHDTGWLCVGLVFLNSQYTGFHCSEHAVKPARAIYMQHLFAVCACEQKIKLMYCRVYKAQTEHTFRNCTDSCCSFCAMSASRSSYPQALTYIPFCSLHIGNPLAFCTHIKISYCHLFCFFFFTKKKIIN